MELYPRSYRGIIRILITNFVYSFFFCHIKISSSLKGSFTKILGRMNSRFAQCAILLYRSDIGSALS